MTRGRERTSTGELSDVTAGDDDFPKTGRHTASERHTAACAPPAGSDGGRSYCWHAQPGGLRESRGEKAARERKIQTRVQRGEGPRCLSLGSRARVHRRGPAKRRLFSVVELRGHPYSRLQGHYHPSPLAAHHAKRRQLGDFSPARKKKKNKGATKAQAHPNTKFLWDRKRRKGIHSRHDALTPNHCALKIDAAACEAQSHDVAPQSCTRLDFAARFLEKPVAAAPQ